ncbi:MAG: DUF4911 domain-containing protein [bacterium]|nr:DUF4911 domain-containing protein [bacterium]
MQVIGRVLRLDIESFSRRVLVELWQDLALGDMVRFTPEWAAGQGVAGQGVAEQEDEQAKAERTIQHLIVSQMESEQGERVYRAGGGEKVCLFTDIPDILVRPGYMIEKLQPQALSLRIEALIEPADICFLSGLMEGYGDLAVLRTLDGSCGLVELLASASFQREIEELIRSLQKEMSFQIKAVELR